MNSFYSITWKVCQSHIPQQLKASKSWNYCSITQLFQKEDGAIVSFSCGAAEVIAYTHYVILFFVTTATTDSHAVFSDRPSYTHSWKILLFQFNFSSNSPYPPSKVPWELLYKPGIVSHTCNPRVWEVTAVGSKVQYKPHLHVEFKAGLNSMISSLNCHSSQQNEFTWWFYS